MGAFRESSRQERTVKSARHEINRTNSSQMTQSAADSHENTTAAEQFTQHSAAATVTGVDGDLSHWSRKAVNAHNAQMRIEAKVKPKAIVQSQSRSSRDLADDARTVFVGNVALTVHKKVS